MIEYNLDGMLQYMPATYTECTELPCRRCIFWCYGDDLHGCTLHRSLKEVRDYKCKGVSMNCAMKLSKSISEGMNHD